MPCHPRASIVGHLKTISFFADFGLRSSIISAYRTNLSPVDRAGSPGASTFPRTLIRLGDSVFAATASLLEFFQHLVEGEAARRVPQTTYQ
jgi:hypothetical protein